tara:strand:- start:2769 stop:3044 length:276 start_codon:yes stop_codon:yes gene_type:complete
MIKPPTISYIVTLAGSKILNTTSICSHIIANNGVKATIVKKFVAPNDFVDMKIKNLSNDTTTAPINDAYIKESKSNHCSIVGRYLPKSIPV